eukprot:gene1834-6268_t
MPSCAVPGCTTRVFKVGGLCDVHRKKSAPITIKVPFTRPVQTSGVPAMRSTISTAGAGAVPSFVSKDDVVVVSSISGEASIRSMIGVSALGAIRNTSSPEQSSFLNTSLDAIDPLTSTEFEKAVEKSKAEGKSQHECPWCSNTFARADGLRRHMQKNCHKAPTGTTAAAFLASREAKASIKKDVNALANGGAVRTNIGLSTQGAAGAGAGAGAGGGRLPAAAAGTSPVGLSPAQIIRMRGGKLPPGSVASPAAIAAAAAAAATAAAKAAEAFARKQATLGTAFINNPTNACPWCEKNFARPDGLRRHMQKNCPKAPTDLAEMSAAIGMPASTLRQRNPRLDSAGAASDGKANKCPKCGNTFARPDGLKRHMNKNCSRTTSRSSVSSDGGGGADAMSSDAEHICELCQRVFITARQLKQHKASCSAVGGGSAMDVDRVGTARGGGGGGGGVKLTLSKQFCVVRGCTAVAVANKLCAKHGAEQLATARKDKDADHDRGSSTGGKSAALLLLAAAGIGNDSNHD